MLLIYFTKDSGVPGIDSDFREISDFFESSGGEFQNTSGFSSQDRQIDEKIMKFDQMIGQTDRKPQNSGKIPKKSKIAKNSGESSTINKAPKFEIFFTEYTIFFHLRSIFKKQ